MDLVTTEIDYDNDNETAEATKRGICPTNAPTFREYIPNLPTEYIIAFGVLGLVTLALVLNYLEELCYLYRHTTRWQSRDKAKWLLAVYPVTAFTSFITLIAPRTAGINDVVAAIYVALCVYVFVIMLIGQYGGPVKMFNQLRGRGIRFNPPPLCCCGFLCICFRDCTVSRVHLQVIHAMVLQFVLTKPCLAYLTTLMWSDGTYGNPDDAEQSPQTYIMFINTVSTLIAVYGFMIVKDQSVKILSNIYIRQKYFSLQAVLFIVGMQRSLIMAVFMVFNLPCEAPLHIETTVDRYHNMATICEMTLLAMVARIYYRHTAQANIGQLASKYRRISVTLRRMSESLPRPHVEADDTITVLTTQRSAAATGVVGCNAAAADSASGNSPSLTPRMADVGPHGTDNNRATDVDSGCSSLDEIEIDIRF